MKFLKNLGERLGLFILGIVLVAVGAGLTYVEFKSSGEHDYDSKIASIPIVIFFLGIGCIIFTFKKKPFDDPKNDEKPPPPQNDEHLPPPLP